MTKDFNLNRFDRYLPGFEKALIHFDRKSLATNPGSVVGVDPEFSIAYLNRAWDTFAAENGGQPTIREKWNLGANYLEAIPDIIRPIYEHLFEEAHGLSHSMNPLQHEYECSGPNVYRKFQMNLYGLPNAAGILMVHTRVIRRPHILDTHSVALHDAQSYVGTDGLIAQCCHCRRVQRIDDPSCWDWVPDWVEHPPRNLKHGMCSICYQHYYPEAPLGI